MPQHQTSIKMPGQKKGIAESIEEKTALQFFFVLQEGFNPKNLLGLGLLIKPIRNLKL
jgi:hypothetical protein